MSIIKRFIDAFRPLNHERMAANKLHEARVALVEHESAREYHSAMCDMLKARIFRIDSASVPQAERKDLPSTRETIERAASSRAAYRSNAASATKPADWDTANGLHHIEPARVSGGL